MKYLLILIFLTLSVHAQRYNLVSNDLTLWTDEVYIILNGDNVKLFAKEKKALDSSITKMKKEGITLSINNFVLTLYVKDVNGTISQTKKFVEGIEYIND